MFKKLEIQYLTSKIIVIIIIIIIIVIIIIMISTY